MTSEQELTDKKVAVIVLPGTTTSALTAAWAAMAEAWADPYTVGDGTIGETSDRDGEVLTYRVNRHLATCDVESFDAVVVPGCASFENARSSTDHLARLLMEFFATGKPMAVSGHAVGIMAEQGLLTGLRASAPRDQRELVESNGGRWIDSPTAVDEGIVTGRADHGGRDLTAFLLSAQGVIAQGPCDRTLVVPARSETLVRAG